MGRPGNGWCPTQGDGIRSLIGNRKIGGCGSVAIGRIFMSKCGGDGWGSKMVEKVPQKRKMKAVCRFLCAIIQCVFVETFKFGVKVFSSASKIT